MRTGQRMVRTDRGMLVLARVSDLLEGFGEVLDSDDTFDPATSIRTLRIAAATSHEFFLVPHLVAALARAARSNFRCPH